MINLSPSTATTIAPVVEEVDGLKRIMDAKADDRMIRILRMIETTVVLATTTSPCRMALKMATGRNIVT
jgi:hypothetical protein